MVWTVGIWIIKERLCRFPRQADGRAAHELT